MKILSFLAAMLITLSALAHRVTPTRGADGGLFLTSGINPGDTISIQAQQGYWSYLYLRGISGTPQQRVVIINEGGQVHGGGIQLESCTYLKLTGSGSADAYGFLFDGAGVALDIKLKSKCVEAERFYVKGSLYGCWIKNEANCDTTINAWVLDSMSIHHFVMDSTIHQGFYMGSTDGVNCCRPVMCGGVPRYYIPSRLGHISIHHGLTVNTGKAGVQLCNATEGISEIYLNTIISAGHQEQQDQGCGIMVGTPSKVKIWGNTIRTTFTWGIAAIGAVHVDIQGNTIDSAGMLSDTLHWGTPIYVDTRATLPLELTSFAITGNTLQHANPLPDINVGNAQGTMGASNIICGNHRQNGQVSISVAPGVAYQQCGTLPVRLLSFQAAPDGTYVRLTWRVDAEVNFSHYELERSAGAGWQRLASVQGGQLSYAYRDLSPQPGLNQYRLRMVDADGSYTLSEVRVVNLSKQPVTVEAYNMLGQLVLREQTREPNSVRNRLRPGAYLLRYTQGGKMWSEKVRVL